MRTPPSLLLAATLALFAVALPTHAERLGYPPEEFAARRKALAAELKDGLVLLVGKTMPNVATRGHQDNDFYYFTGNEDLNAVLVMNAATGDAHLFLPQQTDAEIRSDGPNWLADPDAAKRHGFASIQPLSAVGEFLARQRSGAAPRRLWTRLQEADEVDTARGTRAMYEGRRMQNPFSAQLSEDTARIASLRTRFPYFELQDVTPTIDRLRMIKTPREIEVLKANGRIAAEAIVNAIKATRPGRFEYELEAEATYHHVRNGVQIVGYPAIVGAGRNGLVWHYQDNGKRLEPGETIVMDYGGALDYMVIDITRTWPVSGRFDDLQRRAYECVLEAQRAGIAAMRPGNTRKQTREIAEAVFKKHGFDPRWAGGAGHFVGMSVHDVGDASLPFAPGMVIAIEPILQIPDKNLHVRIEDTVLITDGDPIVLTAAAPKEIDEVLALVPKAADGPSK
jgi:Xaa-Pro aminopeptidase